MAHSCADCERWALEAGVLRISTVLCSTESVFNGGYNDENKKTGGFDKFILISG